ncbi:MAG TPA: hypothetical protein VLT16_15590 [Candidatus Limnocylindrales bacterium]|nr:hypothetical protein [Candidatus Limnocylindrales bacterium]
MKVLHVFALALMFTLATAAFGQTYSFQGSANMAVSAKAGDVVTVTAVLTTNDIDEDGEGEPLVVSLPGGAFTVSNYFLNQTTHFLALQDNPVIFGQIPGADGDESAQVTFSVRKMRFTPEEKEHFANVALALTATSLGLTTVGGGCALAPEPLVTKVCAIAGLAGGAITGGAALYYQKLALDPNDPNFTVIVVPLVPTLPLIQAQPGITQEEADAFNAWIENAAQQSAYATAIITSINRANTAADAGDTASEQKQLQAAGDFAATLSALLGQETSLRSAAQASVVAAGFVSVPFTVNDVFNTEIRVLFFGLPSPFPQVLTAEGFDQNDINFIAGGLFVKNPFTIAPNSFPEILTNSPGLNDAEKTAAQDLFNFALRSGTPLAAGQMAQAQGFVTGPGGSKTTFATEAHADQQGTILGNLELNDHLSGFSIQQGRVTSAVLIGNLFAISGNFAASDGSAQSFLVVGDAARQTVTISTSNGFSVSGAVTGGNVKVKN